MKRREVTKIINLSRQVAHFRYTLSRARARETDRQQGERERERGRELCNVVEALFQALNKRLYLADINSGDKSHSA